MIETPPHLEGTVKSPRVQGADKFRCGRGISARLGVALLFAAGLLPAPFAGAGQDGQPMAESLPGVWKMEPRVVRGERVVSYQEEATMTINEPLPDGRFPIITRVYKRVVADTAGLLDIPGCEGEKECSYDSATEGIGSAFRSAFYVDYYAEGWIDDLFTVKGNVMTADDGNGPIVFTRVRTLDGESIAEP